MTNLLFHIVFVLLLASCQAGNRQEPTPASADTLVQTPLIDSTEPTDTFHADIPIPPSGDSIITGDTDPQDLLRFARTLIGVPYLYASTDPRKGFDCSGFITYIFNHFGIAVPRSSVDFTYVASEVDLSLARPGDLILFTGTDSSIRVVGHMGLVERIENDKLYFIHSSSGKANGVVITPLERYYLGRFVKIIRVFPDRFYE